MLFGHSIFIKYYNPFKVLFSFASMLHYHIYENNNVTWDKPFDIDPNTDT